VGEIGLDDEQPTTMYQDCQPAIKAAEGKGSMGARTKYMDTRVSKIREWILDQHIKPQYCKTLAMTADLGTKSLIEYQAAHLPAGRDEWRMATHWRGHHVWGSSNQRWQ
jgi:hypothetical protein